MKDPKPAASPESARLINEGIASFRATVDAMDRALSACVLMGQGWAILMSEPYPRKESGRYYRVLARVNPVTRKYEANADRCFPALDLIGDGFCGVCLYDPDTADRLLAQLRDGKGGFTTPEGTTYERKHLRTLQQERKDRAVAMVATLEGIAANGGTVG